MRRGKKLVRGAGRTALLLTVLMIALAAVNVALILGILAVFSNQQPGVAMDELSDGLVSTEAGYTLDDTLTHRLQSQQSWVMLIAPDGQVQWQLDLPPEIPLSYTLNDIAAFSRWYLHDYPVQVWTRQDGLLVYGQPRYSQWKYLLRMPAYQLGFTVLALFCNFLVVLAVTHLMTRRWYQRRDAARTEWIAGVSHDVRTPLALALGYAEGLSHDDTLPEAARKQAQLVCQKSEEISALISDLNLVNRLEYAMEPLNRRKVALPALIREVAVDFLNAEEENGHLIEADIAPKAATAFVEGDPALLKRMLRNLLNNCIRHNPAGCHIRIKLDKRGLRKVIWVMDDGVGFSQAQLSKLSKSPSGELPPGEHGLGLRLVRGICEAHRGRIAFYNLPEGGGACRISLM